MFKASISVGSLVGLNTNTEITPTRAKICMKKTKAYFNQLLDRHREVRELSDENKKSLPRIHQSARDTGWELIYYYIKKWGQPTAKNLEIRITYSYLRKKLGDSCCIATLKNHINKLLLMYKGFLVQKDRGGLGLPNQNTACLVLSISDDIIQFEDERHNEAIRLGRVSAEEIHAKKHQAVCKTTKSVQALSKHEAQKEAEFAMKMATPSSFASIFETIYSPHKNPK